MILSCEYIKEEWDERQKWSHSSWESATVHTSSSPVSWLALTHVPFSVCRGLVSASKDAGVIIHPFVLKSEPRLLLSKYTFIQISVTKKAKSLFHHFTQKFTICQSSSAPLIIFNWTVWVHIQKYLSVSLKKGGSDSGMWRLFPPVSRFCIFWKYFGIRCYHQLLCWTDQTKPNWQQKTVRVGYWTECWKILWWWGLTQSVSTGSHRGRVRPPVLMIDSMLSISVCSSVSGLCKDHWLCFSPPPSITLLLHCAKKLDPVLKSKHFRMKFFWSPNCSCDYRLIDTLWCPQPARPAGTGNDAIHVALTLTGPRETTASLTRKMLSISAAGWLCPVIVILTRLWHLCYVDGKCFSNHLLAALFEFSSTLMDSFWRIIIKKIKSPLTPNATASSMPWPSPTELVTKAVDSGTASPSGPLPFSCCVAAQRLNLMTFLIVMERGLVIGHALSQTSQTPCPESGAYIHVREQQHSRARVFYGWGSIS